MENLIMHLNLLTVSPSRQMWLRTTRPPYTTRLQSAGGANLPNVGAQVDAAYSIPASGAVYILAGTVIGSLQSIT